MFHTGAFGGLVFGSNVKPGYQSRLVEPGSIYGWPVAFMDAASALFLGWARSTSARPESWTLYLFQGWLYKKQTSSMLGIQQWQKRWFAISQTVDAAKYEASMHNNWAIASLVLQVGTPKSVTSGAWPPSPPGMEFNNFCQEFNNFCQPINASLLTRRPAQYYNDPKRTGPGKKPVFLDPSYPARRERLLDAAGRECLSVRDAYGGKVVVLACQAGGEVEVWVNVINMLFTAAQSRGGGSRGEDRPQARPLPLTR